MPEISFWSFERINHSPVGQLTLPGGPLGLMALCVFGFGFPNFFSSYREVFSEGFTNHFSCIFSSSIERFCGFLVRNFCLEFFLFFPLKG